MGAMRRSMWDHLSKVNSTLRTCLSHDPSGIDMLTLHNIRL